MTDPISPSVSCILPVYNGSRFIGEALGSILEQTSPVAEIIVVDDGSTDDLDSALAKYQSSIRLFRQTNKGPAAARNRGIRESRGDFLAFLDADDLWHADKINRQLARFRSNPELELSLTLQRPFWVPEMRDEQARLVAEGHPFVLDHAGNVCQCILMPRETFIRVGEFNESLRIGEDTDWLLRARELGVKSEMIEQVLLFRRLHQNNLSYSVYSDRMEDRIDFLVEHLKRKRNSGNKATE